MKRLLVSAIVLLTVSSLFAQGIPFLRNYSAKEYHAHNRNFDVVAGDEGSVYFANFEGLLYYDNVEWRMIHTPGITRITVVYRDKNNIVWVGGYNYFGRLAKKSNGELYLQQVGSPGVFHGEVEEIWENDDEVVFLVNDGNMYKVEGNKVVLKKQVSDAPLGIGLSDIVKTDALDSGNDVVLLEDVTQTEPLENGLKAVVKKGKGLVITDDKGKELYTITEANGLCSNNVVWISYNGHGLLWGATENGIFSMAIPSAVSRFTANEGLSGEVLSIEEFDGTLYVGTNDALFRLKGKTFVVVPEVRHACWCLVKSGQSLLAATADGVYRILAGGAVRQLSTNTSTALLDEGSQFYSGELDGLFLIQTADNSRKKVCPMEKVSKILKDGQGTIWLQNTYGEVWSRKAGESDFQPYKKGTVDDAATIVPIGDKVEVVSSVATTPFPYPLLSYQDDSGTTWLTDNEGKALYRWKDGKRLDDMNQLLHSIKNISVGAMLHRHNILWLGDDNGLTIIDMGQKDPALQTKPRLMFRSVTLSGDSILWGGYGEMPQQLPRLDSDERNLRFTYSVDFQPLVGTTLYRYRLNNGSWSTWAEDNDAEFINLSSGSYTIDIQARMPYGVDTEVVSMKFRIAYPFYLRWYMLICHFILIVLLIYLIFRYRLHRLNVEKHRLESIVQERTAEVVKQKDEIEEKSKSLEKALDDLSNAQSELIRQEKMATAGKLTQGLIDRILNPLNYINNFSKLSEGLVKDLEANIEDEKDNMDNDNYEDTMDVLDMLRGNLQKVSEHGQSTTRILKAMEEMLKDRTGGIVPMNLVPVLRQDQEMVSNYFDEAIKKHGIKTVFDVPQDAISINGNAEQLSMTLMSLLGNAVYAVTKKAQRVQFQPEITVTANQSSATSQVTITIRDNGIGIEDTIINKVFDPFFTTKPTGEAAGVGLYLSREIIQNHGGDISVKSEKDQFTEFIITLPIV